MNALTVLTVATPTLSLDQQGGGGGLAATTATHVTVAVANSAKYSVTSTFTLGLIGDANTAPFKDLAQSGHSILTLSATGASSQAGAAKWTVQTNPREWKLEVLASKAGEHTVLLPAVPNVYVASAALTIKQGESTVFNATTLSIIIDFLQWQPRRCPSNMPQEDRQHSCHQPPSRYRLLLVQRRTCTQFEWRSAFHFWMPHC